MKLERMTLFGLVLATLSVSGGLIANETEQNALSISPEYLYQLDRVSLKDGDMAYIEVGEGDPILLIHGNPTSSYLWRNVIPHIEPLGRVIAIDLMGFGGSDKPEIDYRFVDHQAYLESFIDDLELTNITLVAHDWGSALALDYARRHPDNIKGVALMEALLPPVFPFASFEDMGPIADTFRAFRDPEIGRKMLLQDNFFIEKGLPGSVLRELSASEMDYYREPFQSAEARTPIWRFTQEVPIGGSPPEVESAMLNYAKWLSETDKPILYLYAEPGLLNPAIVREWLLKNVRNLETQFIGASLHYVQEDQPFAIGRSIEDWGRRNER